MVGRQRHFFNLPLYPHISPALRVAGASERIVTFLILEEVHRPSTMGAQRSVFGKDPFAARHELSVTHKINVPLAAVDMTVFIERGGIARRADDVYPVDPVHKGRLGSFWG
jgi:hypothetical protein